MNDIAILSSISVTVRTIKTMQTQCIDIATKNRLLVKF